jgi:hypothetical protein
MTGRLSKLQKWILARLLKRSDSKYNLLLVREIFFHYYQIRNNKLEVTVSRSIRNLYKKGLIIPLTSRTILKKANTFKDMLKGKPDYSQTLAISYQKAGKNKEDYDKHLQELIKRHGRKGKLLDYAVVEAGETIQAVELSELGKKTALMLSIDKNNKLNNKEGTSEQTPRS